MENNTGCIGHAGDMGPSGKVDRIEATLVDTFNNISKACGYYLSDGKNMPEHLRKLQEAIHAYINHRDHSAYVGAPGGNSAAETELPVPHIDEELIYKLYLNAYFHRNLNHLTKDETDPSWVAAYLGDKDYRSGYHPYCDGSSKRELAQRVDAYVRYRIYERRDLLAYYYGGLNDGLKQLPASRIQPRIFNTAYTLGRLHAGMGNDVLSVGIFTDSQILDMIYSKHSGDK
jgi:hypothetical protein